MQAATGCCSRVALSGMLRGFGSSSAGALPVFQMLSRFFDPGPGKARYPGTLLPPPPCCTCPSAWSLWFAEVAAICREGVYAFLRAAGWRTRSWSWAACWTRSAPPFAPPDGGRGAGPGRHPPCWTRSTSSFAAEVRAAGGRALSWSWTRMAAATSLSDEVYAFLRAVGWRARSWSWRAAAITLLDELYVFLRAAGGRARSWSWTVAAIGRGLRLPSRRWVASAELELEGGCYHSFGQVCAFLRACGWRARCWSWRVAAIP